MTVTEPLRFQLDSFKEHKKQIRIYIEQNKTYVQLRRKIGRARAGSKSHGKLKTEFESLGAERKR